ncbi:sulfatase [Patescibacteria group bacterium]|nr:sulfatase [Patescibacteria group bacterium]
MLRKYIIIAAIIGLLTFSAGVLFYFPKSSTPSSKKLFQPPVPYNVILVIIDTLRADHLGMYGYSRNTSPNLDRLAKESILFEQAITQAPYSLASQISLLVSQYPSVHGVIETSDRLSLSSITLAQILQETGYTTAAFAQISGTEGYSLQGFDLYDRDFGPLGYLSQTIPPAVEWLRLNKGENFFLFVQGYDVHPPLHKPEPFDHIFDPGYDGILSDHEQYYLDYTPNQTRDPNSILYSIKNINHNPVLSWNDKVIPLEQRDIDHVIAHYDGGILYTDSLLEEFFDTLKEMGVYDNSIIIVLSDHGEMLVDSLRREKDENDRLFGHGRLYEEVIHVPLFIKHPDFEGQRISTQVQLIDIFPTILDFLHIPISEEIKQRIQGKSLVPLIEDRADEHFNEYVFGQADGHQPVFIRTVQWKLMVSEGYFELYNLQDDPKETQNVIDQYPDVAEKLKQKFEEWESTNLRKKSQLEKNHTIPDL